MCISGLTFCLHLLDAFLYHFYGQYEVGSLEKDLFTTQAKNYARLSIGKKWDGGRRDQNGMETWAAVEMDH